MPLRHQIVAEIRERGPIPFSRYMELCLYDPVEGYYSRNSAQFGKAGDFYTSSDVHAVFGRLLARQFEEMWRALDRPNQLEVLELGPGRGLFARDVLDWSQKKFPDFFATLTYTLQESSPALGAKLAENLATHINSGKAVVSERRANFNGAISDEQSNSKITVPEERSNLAQRSSAGNSPLELQVLEGRPDQRGERKNESPQLQRSRPAEIPLIVFANEFFDALPVEIMSTQGKLHLGFEGDRLTEVWLPPTADELEFLDRYSVHPEPSERIEVPLAAQHWIAEIAAAIGRGFLLIIDYGYTRNEQLAGRHRGTLMTYRQHSASANPYEAPGEQDITAHVNFTALSAVLEQSGMNLQRLITQSQFLMGIGEPNQFADVFEECRVPQERAKVALQLKHLISPEGMGETFRVLLANRGIEPDKAALLSGLRFAK